MLYSYCSFIFKLLNISTFVENNINKMKKLDWFILVILLISPILINYIVYKQPAIFDRLQLDK